MSFVFRGSRSELDTGFPRFMSERRALRFHAGYPVNSKSVVFLVTVFVLFMILNSHQMSLSPNFLVFLLMSFTMLWLVLGVFLMAATLRMYATCQRAQAQAHAVAASGLLGHTEVRMHMSQSIALARLQFALLDWDFGDLDYETLRALDSDNVPTASMSEEEINALPVHKYKVTGTESCGSSMLQTLSSKSAEIKKQDTLSTVGSIKALEDELTCSVCLDEVNAGELIRTLPCLHQFHANCIYPWLRKQRTCPVCKFRVGSA